MNTLKKRKHVLVFAIIFILVSTTVALTWMWLSNTVVDDVEVLDQPMTLTLLDSPSIILKGTWPEGPSSTWTFNLTVDSGVTTMWDFHVMISWDEYNSSESYSGLILQNFNGTGWGGFYGSKSDYLDLWNNLRGPDGEWSYQWQAGDSVSFTLGIIIDTTLAIGNYHFEFAVYGALIPLI